MITEEKKIYLGKTFRDCPACWKKFFNDALYSKRRYGASIKDVNDKLRSWNAQLLEKDLQHIIEFDTDEDKLLFLISWA